MYGRESIHNLLFPGFMATKIIHNTRAQRGGGGVLKKVLYGEAPPRGPTPYPFIYHFFQKRLPFRIPVIGKRHRFHIPS